MANFDQVLARIQSQLESMKKSLLHRREQYSEVVRQEKPEAPQQGGSDDSPQTRKNVPGSRPG